MTTQTVVTVRATVRNVGLVPGTPTNVTFTGQGVAPPPWQKVVGGLSQMAPGVETVVSTTFKPFRSDTTVTAGVAAPVDADSTNDTRSGSVQALCNLALTDLTAGPLAAGVPTDLVAMLQETADEAASNVVVRFYEGSPSEQGSVQIGSDVVVASLAASGQQPVTSQWTPTTGTHTIYAVVDPLSQEIETDESDNIIHQTFSSLPNLAVTNVTAIPGITANGQTPVTVRADVTNNGVAPAPETNVGLFSAPREDAFQLIATTPLVSLAVGAATTVEFVVSQAAGLRRYQTQIDPDNAVEELARHDNTGVTELSIEGSAALALGDGDLSLSIADPVEGQIVTVDARVHNNGDWPATEVLVTAQVGDNTYARKIPVIPAGESAVVSVPWFTSSYKGSQTINVQVVPPPGSSKLLQSNAGASLAVSVTDPAAVPPRVQSILVDKGTFNGRQFKTMSVEFNKNVQVDATKFTLTRTHDGSAQNLDLTDLSLVEFQWSPFTKRAIFVFYPNNDAQYVTDPGSYRITMNTAGIVDEQGNQLIDDDENPGDEIYTAHSFIILPPPGDSDQDGDVDKDDFDRFEACASGPSIPYAGGCEAGDLDRDGDIDQSDFSIFQRCFSGENVPADPNCAN